MKETCQRLASTPSHCFWSQISSHHGISWSADWRRHWKHAHRPGLETLIIRFQQPHDGGRGVVELVETGVGVWVCRPGQLKAQPHHLAAVEAALTRARQRQSLHRSIAMMKTHFLSGLTILHLNTSMYQQPPSSLVRKQPRFSLLETDAVWA